METAISAEPLLSRYPCDRGFSLGPVGVIGDQQTVGEWLWVAEMAPHQKGAWTAQGFSLADKARVSFDGSSEPALKLPLLWQSAARVVVASGEAFVASSSHRSELLRLTGAQAVDMNLFGLAAACASHRLPLISWRIVSDRADDRAAEDFQKFVAGYDGAGGKALAEMIRNLPANPIADTTVRSFWIFSASGAPLRSSLAADAALMLLASSLLGYVDAASEGDPEKILSAGLGVRNRASKPQPLPAPVMAGSQVTQIPGELELRWSAVPGARTYLIERTTDAMAATGWTNGDSATKTKAIVKGLAQGNRYSFRVAAVGPLGTGPWSEPIVRAI